MSEPIEEIASSRYAARLLAARPELAVELVDPAAFSRDEMACALEGTEHDDEAALKRRLRRLRQRVVLRVMARDLSRRADLDEVCGAMSDLAELEISTALRWLGAEDLVVVGMGKLGGRELNVSSDIDLVFLYLGAMDQQERYETAGKKLIRLLAEHSEDGFAFRVDMRLRPFGDSGPLVCSFDCLETYLIAHGREWERYAWLKARPLTGSHHEELMKIVRPFVFRKYLDYATLGAMRRLHAEVRREVARRELADHVKLGPGGIREIEFVAQALQLVRGGRDAALTTRPTREALKRLAKPRASSPTRTGSCARSSTGCSTSTTRSATTCRRKNRIARAWQRWLASLPGRLFPPACSRCAVRSRAISRTCSPNATRKPRRGPSIRVSTHCAPVSATRRFLPTPGAGSTCSCRRSRRQAPPPPIRRLRSPAASTSSKQSRAAPPTSPCWPRIRARSSASRGSSAPRAGRPSS